VRSDVTTALSSAAEFHWQKKFENGRHKNGTARNRNARARVLEKAVGNV
jgi:hypothetical protein